MWLSNCFKIPKLSLRDFVLKSILSLLAIQHVCIAQEKIGYKQFTDLKTEGAWVSLIKNKPFFWIYGDVASDSNKSHTLNILFDNNFDTLQTIRSRLTNNISGSSLTLLPFQNNSNQVFYWGRASQYPNSSSSFNFIFGNANQSDYSLISHRAYHSKYYHVPSYTNTFLNDTTFISVHNFKWSHPSALPYGTSIWWFNANTMDTLQQKVYFEASGNTDLTPFTVYPLPNKDILVSGYTDTVNLYNGDAFLMRLDSVGNVKYARSIGTSASELMYLAKVDTTFYLIGNSSPSYSANPNSNIYLSKVDITNGNLLKTYKIIHDSIGITLMGNVSVHDGKIFVPCNTYSRAEPPYKLKSFYFIIDTNGFISKQYIHSQASNGYWNSYTMPIVTDSLKNVYGSIVKYNYPGDPHYTSLFKLDSNLVGCYPSDTPFSFTTTIANGELHSLPMSIVTAKDSIFEVTTPGAIIQGHGFNTMVDECSGYVGIKEYENEIVNSNFKIYPNPTNSLLNIINESNDIQNATIEIKNNLGEILLSLPFINQINLEKFSPGIYFLSIQNNTCKQIFKIIKQ